MATRKSSKPRTAAKPVTVKKAKITAPRKGKSVDPRDLRYTKKA